MTGRLCATVTGILVFTFSSVFAQTGEPGFAAVSIKLTTIKRYGGVELKPGRLTANDVSVGQLVNAAYGLTGSGRLIIGPNCPKWIASDRFDVEAVVEEGSVPDHLNDAQLREKMQPLLQRLLAERFQLVIRRASKEMSVYKLTVAEAGGKLTKAAISEDECLTSPECHQVLGNWRRGLRGTAVSMTDLAFAIESGADRPVIDATVFLASFLYK